MNTNENTQNEMIPKQTAAVTNMDERKVLFFIVSLIFYCLYSVNMWFLTKSDQNAVAIPTPKPKISGYNPRAQPVLLIYKDACSVLDVFTKKLRVNKARKIKIQDMDTENNTITVIGITVFLVILLINALLDILKVKEEERARRKLNPDGERRKSLAEFANKKILRRESSKFGAQLFQIAESTATPAPEENKSRRETRPYTRGESINSFLSEKTQKIQESSAPASIGDTSDVKLVKRQSVAKLIGARPVPMVRRSSFPVLPQNPDVHALMMSHRQSSVDSDDESEGKRRRVRILRRF